MQGHAGARPVRPLLKWAGGKRQLLPVLAEHYPSAFSRYIEPFVGSGAVFFDLLNSGRLTHSEILLCDVNPDLIGCYWMVRDQTVDVIRALKTLAREYRDSGHRCYYDVRDRRFNPARAELQMRSSGLEVASRYTPELAAMLIFLNRTGFNGLFRLNRRGGFNVPAGEAYVPVEGPRGEHGFYVVSDGGNRPIRVKARAPSLLAVQGIQQMVVGGLVADLIAVIGSTDVVMGDVDR